MRSFDTRSHQGARLRTGARLMAGDNKGDRTKHVDAPTTSMLKNKHLKDWSCIVSQRMAHLSIPQAIGLATWSFGVVMTKSSSLTQVSHLIAQINAEKTNTVRQRLKEWYQEAPAKKGLHRRELDVHSCFAPLMLWVLSLLPPNVEDISFALDATSIGDKFTVLSMNILLAGSGIPVAGVRGECHIAWKLETALAKTDFSSSRCDSSQL